MFAFIHSGLYDANKFRRALSWKYLPGIICQFCPLFSKLFVQLRRRPRYSLMLECFNKAAATYFNFGLFKYLFIKLYLSLYRTLHLRCLKSVLLLCLYKFSVLPASSGVARSCQLFKRRVTSSQFRKVAVRDILCIFQFVLCHT